MFQNTTQKELCIVPLFDTEGPTTGREDLADTWNAVRSCMTEMNETVRHELRDSLGSPMIFSWFLLDWVGYDEQEPSFKKRGHATGFHRVYDEYRSHILSDAALTKSGDGLYWHYHHPPKNGGWGWNRDWEDSRWYETVLNKKILERNFFPSVFRAGGYVEDTAASEWLERWIPFDYSNNSPAFKEDAYDWKHAPRGWIPYHPSRSDYQMEGDMARIIARSLPVLAKGGSNTLSKDDCFEAFEEAQAGKRSILSFHTHDYYKSACDEFRMANSFLQEATRAYPDVLWRWSNAREAVRTQCSLPNLPPLVFSVTRDGATTYHLQTNHRLFGAEPYVVARYRDGTERRVPVEIIDETHWTLSGVIADIAVLGVAGNDAYGNTAVLTI